MKYLLSTILYTAISICIHVHSQTPIKMEEKIIAFGNNTFAIQIMGYTSLVVIGSNDVLITDPATTARAQILKSEIAKLTSQPVTYIVLSHEHYDHIGGTEVFDNAKIVGHEFMEVFFKLDITDEMPSKLDISFRDRLSIQIDSNKTVDLYYYGPGDGVTTTIIHMPQQDVVVATDLFVADAALFHGRVSMDDVNLLGTREILNKIITDLKPKHVLNGHHPITDVENLWAYSKFYNDLYEYCNEWIVSTKSEYGPGAIYSKTLDFTKTAEMPKYSHWKNYANELETYVRRMVMSIHHGG